MRGYGSAERKLQEHVLLGHDYKLDRSHKMLLGMENALSFCESGKSYIALIEDWKMGEVLVLLYLSEDSLYPL